MPTEASAWLAAGCKSGIRVAGEIDEALRSLLDVDRLLRQPAHG